MFNMLIEWVEKLMTPETQPSEWRTRAKAAEALARDFETQNARLRVIIRKIQDDMKAINDMLQCGVPTSNPFFGSQNCASSSPTDVKPKSPASPAAPSRLAPAESSAAANEPRSAGAAHEVQLIINLKIAKQIRRTKPGRIYWSATVRAARPSP
jgi:hypothetical protein